HVNAPPKENWTCDVCGGKVVQREDDTEDAVMRRLELYEEETVPIIDFYRKLGKLVVVDGTGDGEEVFKRLVEQVDQRLEQLKT
ncbi:MAG TPA: adenylate kinase, partial [Acidimicrobiia bacterium]